MTVHARIAIIGGGITGCGLAYHLTKLGWSDVLLLEKNDLTAGATWHAAGHLMHYSASALLTRLQKETTDLLPRLEAETGHAVGFHKTGAIRIATTPDLMTDYRRGVAKASALGVDMEMVGPDRIKELFPLMNTGGVLGGVYTPGDGHTDPTGVTFAYAKGARGGGAKIMTQCQVESLEWQGGEWLIRTPNGEVRAEYVVNCAGMWAQEIANMVGVKLPLVVFMHQHLVTEDHPAVEALDRELVLIRDSAGGFNCRQEGRGLLSGVYEHTPEFAFENGIPPEFGQELMTPNLDRSADFIARAVERVPALGEVGIKMIYNGATSRTPDHQPLLGPVPGVPNHFIAAGYAAGIVQAGFSRYVAQWIVEGEPEVDLTGLDVRRFGINANRAFAFDTVRAAHAFSNSANYPYGERTAGRPARTSPLYDLLAAKGAVHGVRAGWEVPNWFAKPGGPATETPRYGRPDWFATVADECRAAAAGAGLLDLSHIAKFAVSGPGAASFLGQALACALPAVGAVAIAPMLTARGTIGAVLSVMRMAEDRFLITGPGAHEVRDFDNLARIAPTDGSVRLDNRSSHLGALLLAGPAAGEIVSGAARSDLTVDFSERAFPSMTVREADLGYAPSIVVRHGEATLDTWQIIVPLDMLRSTYTAIQSAGADRGLIDMGARTLDALRLEAGIPVFGIDLDRETTIEEAGLGAIVDRNGGAIARHDAAKVASDDGTRLFILEVEAGEADAYFLDPIISTGRTLALVGSAGMAHLSGRSLAFARLPAAEVTMGMTLDIEILGQARSAHIVGTAGWTASDCYDVPNTRVAE